MASDKEFQMTKVGQDVVAESAAEYVLPDYNGDVRKILYSEVDVHPESKFIGDDEVEFSGSVSYKIVYSDADNKISGTEFSSDYNYTIKCNTEGCDAVEITPNVSNYAIRLLGPRRFSAKTYLCGNVRYTEKIDLSPKLDEKKDSGSLETKKKLIKVRKNSKTETIEREFAESLSYLEGVGENEIRLLYSKASAYVDSASMGNGAITLKGHLILKCILETESSVAHTAEKRLPVEIDIPCENIDNKKTIVPRFEVVSERFTITPDQTGCDVVANIILECEAMTEENQEIELLEDAFFTNCPTENTYRDFCYSEFIEKCLHGVKHSAEVNRSELCEGTIRETVFVNAIPKIERIEPLENGVKVIGEVKYSGIMSEVNDDGSIGYTSLKYSLPFEENVNLDCQITENNRFDVKISSEDAAANLDAQKVYLSSALTIEVLVSREMSVRSVSESVANEKEKYPVERATVKVYYPEPSEDLFEIARKYHVSVASISSNNSLTEDVSLGGERDIKMPKKMIIY